MGVLAHDVGFVRTHLFETVPLCGVVHITLTRCRPRRANFFDNAFNCQNFQQRFKSSATQTGFAFNFKQCSRLFGDSRQYFVGRLGIGN